MLKPNATRLLFAVSGLALVPGIVAAQTATAPSSTVASAAVGDETADIIVTANKRAERIQDVALAITAITGADLNQRQLLDIQDLATRVPGLSFQRGGNGPSQRLIIRGLNTGGTGATVASVVDDVPFSFSSGVSNGAEFATDFDPFDLNRVEVLKGPQGTLYGANALGGLVKYVTNAPDTTALHGGGEATVFDVAHAGKAGGSIKGYVNVPIIDGKVAIRASGYYDENPAWIGNTLGGNPRTNGFKRYGGRASLLLTPTEDLSIRLTAFLQNLDQDGYDTVEVNGYANLAKPFALLKGYNRDTYVDQPSKNKSRVYSGNLSYDLGGVTIQSITSYGTLNTQFQFDNPVYGVLFGGLYFGRPNTTLVSGSVSSLKKFNQEFRLSSDNNAAKDGHGLEWQIGAFYTHEKANYTNNYITRDFSGDAVFTPISPTSSQVFLASLDSKYRELAAYADATYHFSPQFDIEAGGRVFGNKQKYLQTTGGALLFPPDFMTTGPFKSSETKATFSVAPRYHFTPDAMIYARVASGYRPGGPNPLIPPATLPTDTPVTPPSSYTSDSTVNYEVGVKASAFQNMLTIDVTAFYIDWKDIQVVQSIRRAFTGYSATINGGKAKSKGVEWSFNLRPARGLALGWLGAYTDVSLNRDVPEINGTKGTQLPYTAKWTTTLTADYEFPAFGDYRGFVGGSYSYIGKRFTNYSFDPTRAHLEIPSYDTFALQAGLRGDRFGVQVYGKNLGDKRGITSYDPGQNLLVFGPPGYPIPGTEGVIRPREIGLRLTANF